MQWNKKYIGICLAALILLAGILTIKGIQTGTQDGTGTAAREEQFSTDDFQSVSEGALRDTATPQKKKTGKEKLAKPTETAGEKDAEGKNLDKKKENKKDSTKAAVQTDKKKRTKDSAEKNTPSPSPDRKPAVTQKPVVEKKREVTLRVDCTRIMQRKDLWKDGLEEIIPASGMFYSGVCSFRQGASAYDVLKEACQRKNIALDSQYTPIYHTYYIRGIGNLYEFDCGEESGWKYAVNGKTPGVGCSGYTVKAGDVITFFYDYQY